MHNILNFQSLAKIENQLNAQKIILPILEKQVLQLEEMQATQEKEPKEQGELGQM
jgi:hypothetical protein